MVIRADRPEPVTDLLRDVCQARVASVKRGDGPFFFQANQVELRRVGHEYCAYDADVE